MNRIRHHTGRRRRKHEDHANHEAWAIPYGDLLTLLLAFFVVMYAISSVNAGKYRVLSDSLFAAFRGEQRRMEPIQVGERESGTGADMQTTVVQQSDLDNRAQTHLAPIPVQSAASRNSGNALTGVKLPPQAAAAAAALSHVADEVERAMNSLVQKNMVTVRRNDFWIEVEMRTDILFPSGSAKLAPSATDIIQQLGSVLAPFPNPIRVEGHTDNVPIKTAVFSSNWELSAARAGSVVRVLASHGVAPERLAVIGYGEQRPLKGNDTSDGRNANRRVVVVILSTELMRQNDPGQLTPPAGGAGTGNTAGAIGTAVPGEAAQRPAAPVGPAGPAPASGLGSEEGSGGAIALPGDAPQAIPVPAPPPTALSNPRAADFAAPPESLPARTGTDSAP